MILGNFRACAFAAMLFGLAVPAFGQPVQSAEEAQPSDTVAGATDAATALPVFETLYRFPGGKNSRWPRGGVVLDSAGNVYGTTLYPSSCMQGLIVCGIVYKLAPPHGTVKTWTFKILHEFGHTLQDGIGPTGPLTLVGTTLFGTTSAGADPNCGCGEVFSISTTGAGYKKLYVFRTGVPYNPVNGSTPITGVLVVGTSIYGTTSAGGKNGAGVIYTLKTNDTGFRVLHHFSGPANGGSQGELLLGKDNYLYGTQFGGGTYKEGTVFRIARTGAGFQVLYNFKGVNRPGNSTDGAQPEGRLVQLADGTIYGTTAFGGTPGGYGTAWSLKLTAGKWVYKQIRRFTSTNTTREDANLPHSGLVQYGGALYGTGAGGGHFQSGAIYKLTPPRTAGGPWGYVTLRSFVGRNSNGDTPFADVTINKGYLYGSNLTGGRFTSGFNTPCPSGCGTVFRQKL